MIMKSRQSLLDKITETVQKNHSYDTPEVIAIPILGGSQKYIQWVLDTTQQ
jgi:periplasmic divalent cation tolerance protein